MLKQEIRIPMSDGFLQILLDLHVRYNIYTKEFAKLLDEKLKRNEIWE